MAKETKSESAERLNFKSLEARNPVAERRAARERAEQEAEQRKDN